MYCAKPAEAQVDPPPGRGVALTDVSRAVFLSYASQDANAARRIAAALSVAGIEVWLDQSELRGGDVWDQKIRREIHDCSLFIPVISANTASRHEGYFRLEWNLADQRTEKMARNHVFVVPVCLDATPEQGADVPESFKRVQWTRLPGGETPPVFVERVRRLLSPELPVATPSPASAPAGPVAAAPISGHAPLASTTAPPVPVASSRGSRRTLLAVAAVVILGALAYLAIEKPWMAKTAAPSPVALAPAAAPRDAPAGFSPPPHSIAVLPFVNLSGDKGAGLLLRRTHGGTVQLPRRDQRAAGRCAHLRVFLQRSEQRYRDDRPQAQCRLNPEGSVRRSGHTIRISAQLINALTGFHLWSKDLRPRPGRCAEASDRDRHLQWRKRSR